MKKIILSLMFLILGSVSAHATWYQRYDSNADSDFATTHAAVAAGNILVNGWTDQAGFIYSTAAGVLSSVNGTVFYNDILSRPANEDYLNAQVIYDMPTSLSGTVQMYLRWNRTLGTNFKGYGVQFDAPNKYLNIYKVNTTSTVTEVAHVALSPTYNSSHTYEVTFSATGTSSVALSAVAVDTTASTTVATATYTDSSSPFSTAGAEMITNANSSGTFAQFTRVRTYSDTQQFVLTPTSGATSSALSVTAVGTGTAWTSGTTFTSSSSQISSIVTNSVDVAAQTASLTINTSSTTGTATIADTTDALTTTFLTSSPSIALGTTTMNNLAKSTFTITGTATSWTSGTTATISGAGASIVTNSVNVGAQTMNVTVTATSGYGTATIGDSTDGATAALTVTGWYYDYDSNTSSDFAGTNGPVSAGTILVNGWKELYGSVWTTASGVLSGHEYSATPDYELYILGRPTSENATNERVIFDTTSSFASGQQAQVYLRWNNTTGSTFSGYVAVFNTSNLVLVKVNNGSITTFNTTSLSPSYNSAHTYHMDFTVTGSSPAVLTGTVTDNNTGSVVATNTASDSSSPFTSGGYAAVNAQPSVATYPTYTRIQLLNQSGGITVIPTSGFPSSTISATMTGSGTAWTSGTTFTSASSQITSITTNSVNVGAQTASITIQTSATTGVATIADSTDAFTTPFTVSGPTFTLSPTSGNSGSSTSVTATGSSTSWTSGTTFNITGVTSGTVVTNSVNVGAQTASLTISTTGTNSGTATLSDTTDSATQTFTVLPNIPINSSAWFFSPDNWFFSGSTFAQAVNAGAYFKFAFTGTSAVLNFDTSNLGTNQLYLSCMMDGGVITDTNINGTSSLTLGTGLTNTSHQTQCWYKGRVQGADSWNTPVDGWKITSMLLSSGATLGTPTVRPYKMLVYGDSRVEGIFTLSHAADATSQDSKTVAAFTIGQAFNAEVGVKAFGGLDFTITGSTNVPGVFNPGNDPGSSWNKVYSGASLLNGGGQFSVMPDYIFVLNLGVNGRNVASSTEQAAVNGWLNAVRAAAPNAKIYLENGSYESLQATAFTNAFNAYQAATPDPNAFLFNPGLTTAEVAALYITNSTGTYGCPYDGIHPDVLFQELIAGDILSQILSTTTCGSTFNNIYIK